MTNAASNNQIEYTRLADGSLGFSGSFATGGNGSGGTIDPLSSQGSLTLSADLVVEIGNREAVGLRLAPHPFGVVGRMRRYIVGADGDNRN
jgi:hypothetical protein